MARQETYPWSRLNRVGDYFVVPETMQPHSYMSRYIAQKNAREKATTKREYGWHKIPEGTIVFLIRQNDEAPDYTVRTIEGILINSKPKSETPAPVEDMERPLTLKEKVNRLTHEEKLAHLPWWFVDGKLVTNPKIIQDEDAKLFMRGELRVTQSTPYPDRYNLGPDMRKISREELWESEEEEEEDWGPDPIFGEEGDGNND